MKKTVLSGIRATGRLHLGNYLGAVKGMLELQNDPQYQTLYMVADVHALTTPFDVQQLKINRREVISIILQPVSILKKVLSSSRQMSLNILSSRFICLL